MQKDRVENHFLRLDNTIQRSNAMTLEATKILTDVWNGNFENGLPQGQNVFDEKAERMWTSIWLFFANSTRFAPAMAGGRIMASSPMGDTRQQNNSSTCWSS